MTKQSLLSLALIAGQLSLPQAAVAGVSKADSVGALAWTDLPGAMKKARDESRVVLVFARAKGCGPCRLMETKVFPEVRPIMEQLSLARVDFAERSSHQRIGDVALSPFEWSRRFGIEATPGFALIAPDGKTILRENGLLDPEAFGLFLAYGSTRAYRHGSFEEYINTVRPQ